MSNFAYLAYPSSRTESTPQLKVISNSVDVPSQPVLAQFDINVVVTAGIALVTALGTYYLMRSKSQARELDEDILNKTTQMIETHSERLEKVATKLEESVNKLAEKIEGLNDRIISVETKQKIVEYHIPVHGRELESLKSRFGVLEGTMQEVTRTLNGISTILDSVQTHLAKDGNYNITHKTL